MKLLNIKLLFLEIFLCTALYAQVTPQIPQPVVADPTGQQCHVSSSTALKQFGGTVYSCQGTMGTTGAYAILPGAGGGGGSLTPAGIGVGGATSANTLKGPANVLVVLDGSGNGAALPTINGDGVLNLGTGALAISKIGGVPPGTLFPINTGTVVAGPSGSAIKGLKTVDGVNYSTIAAAYAAALADGTAVSIPASYPCTEQSTSTGVPVFDARPCSHRTWDVSRDFNAHGDGAIVTGCAGTSGLLTVTCSGRPFVATDQNRVIGFPIAGQDVFLSTISSVNTGTGVATIANALPLTFDGTQSTWLVTDDTAAFDAWNAYLNAHPGSTGTIQNGWYWFSHTYYFTQDVLIAGQGMATTHLTNSSPNKDWFVFKSATSGQAGVSGIRDLSFYGLGNHTTGNMIIPGHPNFFADSIEFVGSAGRGILGSSESDYIHNMVSQSMRQTITNPDNVSWNETRIDGYRISNPGIVANGIFGGGAAWNWNINSVNGVFPASGSILQDDHSAIDIANNARFHLADGTVKPLTGIGAVKNRGAVGEFNLDNLYCEFFSASSASPCFQYGGPRETAALSAGITTTALQIPLVAGQVACGNVPTCTGAMWWPGYIGDPADLLLVGTAAGANTPFSLFIPPDFLSLSAAASSIGGGILRGDFEYVRMQGMVNDTGGFSAYLIASGRGLNGTTAKAWPAGAVFMQGITESFGAFVTLTNNRLLASNHDSTTWPISQNTDLGQTKGAVVVGQTPDLFHVPGGPNALTGNRQVFFGPGNFIGIPVSGMYAVEAATSATMISSASGNQASPCATPDYIFMSGFGLNANRDYYANGNGAFMSYLDPTMKSPMSISATNTTAPRGDCSSQGNVVGAITGNIDTSFGTYTIQDDPDAVTGQSLQRLTVAGNRAPLPGLEQDIWTGSAWLPVWQNYCTGSQAAPWCNQKLQMGNGIFSLVSSGSVTTMTFPGSDASHVNIITTLGTAPLDIMDTSHCFFDHSGQFRNNGTCIIGTSGVPMNGAYSTFFQGPSVGSETVASSATPTFSLVTRASVNTLTASVTSFTLAAGVDGQEKALTFCQNGTGNFTVAPPSNVHGFFTVGTIASKCSTQAFTYSVGQTAWLAESVGVINQ